MRIKEFICLLSVIVTGVVGCKEAVIPTFSEKNLVLISSVDDVLVDSVEISATHYPGVDELSYKFEVELRGLMLESNTPYIVEKIDTIIGDDISKYITLVDPIFEKGAIKDSVEFNLNIKDLPAGLRGAVIYQIKENDMIKPYREDMSYFTIWFNNVISQPAWWDKEIEQVYLGVWTAKKFELLVTVTGEPNFNELSANERRANARMLRDYVEANSITEDDGTPMEIPVN